MPQLMLITYPTPFFSVSSIFVISLTSVVCLPLCLKIFAMFSLYLWLKGDLDTERESSDTSGHYAVTFDSQSTCSAAIRCREVKVSCSVVVAVKLALQVHVR